MRKKAVVLLSIIFILSLAAASLAGTKQVSGKVVSVNSDNNTVTVKGRKGNVVVLTADKTVVTSEEVKTLADVKAGDQVTVKYTDASGQNSAKSISIKSVSSKKQAD